jgi:phosphoribosyl-dephospho-CoA transferase
MMAKRIKALSAQAEKSECIHWNLHKGRRRETVSQRYCFMCNPLSTLCTPLHTHIHTYIYTHIHTYRGERKREERERENNKK